MYYIGPLAQLAEQSPLKGKVSGSSPGRITKKEIERMNETTPLSTEEIEQKEMEYSAYTKGGGFLSPADYEETKKYILQLLYCYLQRYERVREKDGQTILRGKAVGQSDQAVFANCLLLS